MEIPFQINKFDESILGIIHKPRKNAKGNPTIIMFYGFNGERVDNNRLSVMCGRLAEQQGVTFVRFDYRGLGVSEGEFWNTTLDTKIEDAKAVIEYIERLYNDEISITALGFSDGVRVITEILDICPNISSVCLWSPVLFTLIDETHGKMRRKFYREPVTNQLVAPHRGLWVGQSYLRQLSAIGNEYDNIIKFDKPLLAIFGGGDSTIAETYQELDKLRQAGQYNISMKMISEADHLYSRREWINEITNETVKWAASVSIRNS